MPNYTMSEQIEESSDEKIGFTGMEIYSARD